MLQAHFAQLVAQIREHAAVNLMLVLCVIVLHRPEMTRRGVLVSSFVTSRTRSHGSSLSSRTVFLRCEPAISSMPSNPALSMFFAIGNIMPVVMFSAHRL